jgi:ABC-type nickel/cobalt efflux system permease component RcnA
LQHELTGAHAAMRRLLLPLLLALALLAVFAAAAGAQTNPFGRGTPSAPAAPEAKQPETKPGDPGLVERWYGAYRQWQFDLLRKQRDLNEWLAAEVRAYKEHGALTPVLMILLVSFLYGVLHAVGPGHGKVATAAYFGANRAAAVHGVMMSALIALIQALSAVLLVGGLAFALSISYTQTIRAGDYVTAASFGLIALVGLWIAWGGIIGRGCTHDHGLGAHAHHDHGHARDHHRRDHAHRHHHAAHDHASHHARHDHAPAAAAEAQGLARMLPVALASGIRPCTGAVLILLLTLSQGIFEIGVVATLVMSFGTFLVVALIGLGVIYARRAASRAGGRRERLANLAQRAVSLVGGLVVFGFGALFLHTALLQLGYKV